MIEFTVYGTPAPKGSSRAMMSRHKNPALRHAILVPSESDGNKEKRLSWDAAVREAARAAVGNVTAPPFVLVPLVVTFTFWLRRPADHWSKKGGLKPWAVHALPMFKPDVSKLVRSAEDVLTGIVYDDDARICREIIDKVYAAPGQEGATITIEQLGG